MEKCYFLFPPSDHGLDLISREIGSMAKAFVLQTRLQVARPFLPEDGEEMKSCSGAAGGVMEKQICKSLFHPYWSSVGQIVMNVRCQILFCFRLKNHPQSSHFLSILLVLGYLPQIGTFPPTQLALYCQLSSSSITGNKFRCSEEEIKPRPQRKSLNSTALLLLIYHRPLGPPPSAGDEKDQGVDGDKWWLIAADATISHFSLTFRAVSPWLNDHWSPIAAHCQSFACSIQDAVPFLDYWSFTIWWRERFLTAKPGSIEPSVCKSMPLVHHPHASRWASPLRPSPQAIDRDLWATCLGPYVFNSSF